MTPFIQSQTITQKVIRSSLICKLTFGVVGCITTGERTCFVVTKDIVGSITLTVRYRSSQILCQTRVTSYSQTRHCFGSHARPVICLCGNFIVYQIVAQSEVKCQCNFITSRCSCARTWDTKVIDSESIVLVPELNVQKAST